MDVNSQLIPSLGSIRLSRLDEESSSPERQNAELRAVRGVRYVAITQDLDVSAYKLHPLKRPELGPWLTDPQKLAKYDQLIVWKLDRFCRSNSDMRDMMKWADDTGKKLVFLVDGLTYDPRATGVGRIVNDVLITFIAAMAEMESFNTSARVTNLHAHLREKKSWKGGHLIFGYGVEKEENRKVLVRSPKTHPLFMEIVERIIGGESMTEIAVDFNARGIYSPRDWSRVLQGNKPKGGRWTHTAIKTLFESDAPLGYRTRAPSSGSGPRETVRDDDGYPIQLWEPLLSEQQLRRVREAIAERSRVGVPYGQQQPSPLRGVVRCYDCDANLSWQSGDRSSLRCYKAAKRTYTCTATARIPISIAWMFLEEFFIHRHGDRPVVKGRYVKSGSTDSGLSALQDEWAAVSEQSIRARSQTARDRLQRRLDELDAAMADIEERQGAESGRWEAEEQSESYRERWKRSSPAERREMIIRAGYALRIKREPHTENYTAEVVETT